MKSPRTMLLLAAVMGFLGVLAGTFGAHGLRDRVTADLLDTFEIGVRYHLIHAVAMLSIAVLVGSRGAGSNGLACAAWQFAAGITLFSGSLHALALSGERSLGVITPVGGALFLGGWVTLAIISWQMNVCQPPRHPPEQGLYA
jgi:uncharacterized membrane protein YgdD (TMEM256/DUF423 family)